MNKLILAAVALLLVLGGVTYSLLGTQEPKLGAAPGPERTAECETRNGVTQCFNRKAFTQATTTVCAIKSPAATSTLVTALVRFAVSSTTASVVTLAQATTPFATTTLNGAQIAIAAGAQSTIQASTTGQGTIFPPNTQFVVGMQGNPGTFSPTGFCQATFEII